jgi:hypothetical protein
MFNIADLEVLEDGTVLLHRDVKAGEVITYQNSYLKRLGKTKCIDVLVDLSKGANLKAGSFADGITVISADKDTEDYLVVKLIK